MSGLANQETAAPVNLLSLDGGGIRGVSELIILDEIMRRLQHDLELPELPKPCDYFQLIGGTSTGGLIALMLGRFQMTTDEALREYNKFAKSVFSQKKPLGKDGRFKATNLEKAIKSIVEAKVSSKDPDERIIQQLQDNQVLSRAFVCAVPSHNMAHPRRFRTYTVRNNASPNCKIWEAARATSAAPTFFKSIRIAGLDGIAETFVDAALRCNNPIQEIIQEARDVFGDGRYVSCILSLGTGHPGTIGFSKPDRFQKLLPTKLITVLKDLAVDCENMAQEVQKRFQNAPDLYFRFNVQHGTGEISFQEWEEMGQVKTHTISYLQDHTSAVDSIVRVLASWNSGSCTSTNLTLGQISGDLIPTPPLKHTVSAYKCQPCSSSLFTGRKAYLDTLEKYFTSREPELEGRRGFLLYGMGGVGKTQICLKFVEKYETLFSRVFWIDGSSRETMEQSFKDIAHNHQTPEIGKNTKAVKQWLASFKEEWLLVFDNVDGDPNVIADFLPGGDGGNLLFTSRNREIRRYTGNSCLEVKEMDEDEAINLLLKAANEDLSSDKARAHAKPIVKTLQYLALAIDQAGAYIGNECSLDDYLDIYSARRKSLLQDHRFKGSSNYGYAVYGTWELSFQAIKDRANNPDNVGHAEVASDALAILQVFGFFHHDGISQEIFRQAAETKPCCHYVAESDPPTQLLRKENGKWDHFSFGKAISELVSFSLINMDTTKTTYSVHPLVHAWIRDRLPTNQRLAKLKTATALLTHPGHTKADHGFWVRLLPHIDACLGFHTKPVNWEVLKNYQSPFSFAEVYRKNGFFLQAGKLYQQALEMQKKVLGVEHPTTLTAMGNLAATYNHQGRLEEAEDLEKQVLEVKKKVRGVEHPDTLAAMGNLAATYNYRGRLEEAEHLGKQVLEMGKKVLGVEHPATLTDMGNLALTYMYQGRLEEAEDLGKQALEIKKKVLGVEHPTTLATMGNLASIYNHQGRLEEAEDLEKQVLEVKKKVLGVEHPDTLAAMGNLAATYNYQGRLEEAEHLGKQVLEMKKKVLGVEHPDTLTVMGNLALTYKYQGRLEEAEDLGKQALEIKKKVLGVEHPTTLTTMGNLASIYNHQGRLEEAEDLEKQVLEVKKKVLGVEHPDTLAAMGNLAATYNHQGRLEEAEHLGKQVLEMKKKVLGVEHPDTLTVMGNLALTYKYQGRLEEAEDLGKQALEIKKKVLGVEHPTTLTTMGNLASIYNHQGRLEEAEDLEKQVLEVKKKVLGVEHPDTLAAMGNLAATYNHQGRLKEVEDLMEQVLEMKKVLGVEHLDTLTAMGNLARTYNKQGRLKEAEDLEKRVLEMKTKALGAEHPATLTAMGNLAATYFGQGHLKEAEDLGKQVLEMKKKVLGIEDPSTLTAMGNLARTYCEQGRLKEAEDLEKQVLEMKKKVLGVEHPNTLMAMGNLAVTYNKQGRLKEAEDLMRQVLEMKKKVLGVEHKFYVHPGSDL